jgi:hypothetical protein
VEIPTGAVVMGKISTDRATFDGARTGRSLAAAFGPGGGMAEADLNPDRSLFLVRPGELAYHYWRYESPTRHRFDEVRPHEGGVTGRRTVERLQVPREPALDVEQFAGSDLYAVFVQLEAGARKEIARSAFKIHFNGPPRAPAGSVIVAQVGDRSITIERFANAYRLQVDATKRAYGGAMDDKMVRGLRVDLQVLQSLIDQEAAQIAAERQGITVTDSQVRERVKSMPAFQEKGKFVGTERYIEILQSQKPPLRHEAFIEEVRRDMAAEKLGEIVGAKAASPEAKAAAFSAYIDGVKKTLVISVNREAVNAVVGTR